MSQDGIDQKIIELQIKCSYLEDMLDKLDSVVIQQQTTIDLLIKEIKLLNQQKENQHHKELQMSREAPPHY